MSSTVFNIDELAQGYVPVVIRFRGKDYALGNSVESISSATSVAVRVPDDAPEEKQIALLPEILGALNKQLGDAIAEEPLTVGERIVLKKVVDEVMERVSNVPFRPSEG